MPFISNVPMAAVTVNNHSPYISSLAKALKMIFWSLWLQLIGIDFWESFNCRGCMVL
jgi:hypothetical protein